MGRGKLLLVEQDPEVRGMVDRVAEDHGWEVRAFADGDEAAASLAREHYDAAMMEFLAPGTDGLTLLSRLQPKRTVPPAASSFRAMFISGVVSEAGLTAIHAQGASLLGKPLTREEVGAALDSFPPSALGALRSVLVASSNVVLRTVIEEHLAGEGFEVESFATGTEALARVSQRDSRRKTPYDYALVELHLLGAAGPSVIRDLAKRSPETLSIMITGEASAAEVQEGYRSGAYGLMLRPFRLRDLSNYLRALEVARANRREECAERAALAKAPLPVRLALRVKNGWSGMSRARKDRVTDTLLVFLLLAILTAICLPLVELFGQAYDWSAGWDSRSRGFMERVEGYLDRDEQRKLDQEHRWRAAPTEATPRE